MRKGLVWVGEGQVCPSLQAATFMAVDPVVLPDKCFDGFVGEGLVPSRMWWRGQAPPLRTDNIHQTICHEQLVIGFLGHQVGDTLKP